MGSDADGDADATGFPLPPEPHVLGRQRKERKARGKTSFMQDACACCTHTEQVDLDPAPIGECNDHVSIKTRFVVRNICCDSEVRLIERIVSPLPGVESISINTFQKICILVHCPQCTAPDVVMAKLNHTGLGAALLGQGNLEINPVTPSIWDMIRSHSRHLIVEISGVLMLLGLLCSNVTGDIFLLLALLLGLCGILQQSVNSLQKGEIDISTLVIFAALAAAFQGERADAALVVLLFNLSKVVESIALNRVSSALRAVLQLQAVHTVHLVDGKACPVSELKPGDVIALRPGEECPADGLVSKGAASCSEAALSGESHPLHKQQGDLISSGAVVLNGYVEVMLTTASSQSAVSMIEAQVEEAQMKRTDRQLMIQRFARWWTPGIVIVVLMMCTLVPLAFGDFQTWSRRGLVILLTACPCAIVIGAPLATTSAIAAAASYGLLIKRPESVEKLPQIATVALDKTGTLTKGELSVLHVENFDPSSNLDQETALKWAAALELRSAHPIAAAVVSKALGCIGDALESQELPTVSDFRVLPGIGIQGYIENNMGQLCKVVLGNKRALEVATACPTAHSKFIAFEEQFSQHSTVAMLVDGKLQLGLALNDTIREDSAKLLEELNVMGFKSTMLTGDTEEAAAFVAESLGIPQDLCHFAMTPEQKRQWVSEREAEGRHVLMLGDGINDATALAVAHVGVAMGETGAALAAQSADIVMMTDKLYRLPQCIRLCRFARRIERLNIAIPCLLKLLQASVAMFVDLKLWIVVLADLGTLLLALLLGVSILSPNFWSSGGFLTVSRIRRFRRRLRQYEQFG